MGSKMTAYEYSYKFINNEGEEVAGKRFIQVIEGQSTMNEIIDSMIAEVSEEYNISGKLVMIENIVRLDKLPVIILPPKQ